MNYLKKNHFIVNFIWRKKYVIFHILNIFWISTYILFKCYHSAFSNTKKNLSSLYDNMLDSCFWSIICTSRIFWNKLSLLNFTKSYFIPYWFSIIDMRGIHLKFKQHSLLLSGFLSRQPPNPPPTPTPLPQGFF